MMTACTQAPDDLRDLFRVMSPRDAPRLCYPKHTYLFHLACIVDDNDPLKVISF